MRVCSDAAICSRTDLGLRENWVYLRAVLRPMGKPSSK